MGVLHASRVLPLRHEWLSSLMPVLHLVGLRASCGQLWPLPVTLAHLSDFVDSKHLMGPDGVLASLPCAAMLTLACVVSSLQDNRQVFEHAPNAV